uniref:Uncharacterized protein n=1 Tax=Oryza barthii TaxID=65489 RepID=A0A0D3G2N3_9ORYZ
MFILLSCCFTSIVGYLHHTNHWWPHSGSDGGKTTRGRGRHWSLLGATRRWRRCSNAGGVLMLKRLVLVEVTYLVSLLVRGQCPELKKKTKVSGDGSPELKKKMEVHWACAYVIVKPWEAYQGYAFGEPASGACVVLPV